MAGIIDARLAELGIVLPNAPPPAPGGSYVPYVLTGTSLVISGQLPLVAGNLASVGKVGAEVSLDQAIEAARLCGINILAQAKAACGGDLDRIARCVRLGGFVNAIPEFTDHPKVINGASDLMLKLLGEAGKHARFAVGAGSLPFNAAVEIEALFALT